MTKSLDKDHYASWADLYDVMIDWPSRLKTETPVIQRFLRQANAQRVLDFACGTGMHSWMMAQNGYTVTGVDLSEAMISLAESQSKEGVNETPEFLVWNGADSPPEAVDARAPFDAALCFGNSFSHLDRDQAMQTLLNLGSLIRPGGILLFQMKNLLRRSLSKDVYLPVLRRKTSTGDTALFVRLYEFVGEPPKRAVFHMFVCVTPANPNASNQEEIVLHEASHMQIWQFYDLTEALIASGFENIRMMPVEAQSLPFDPNRTEDFYLYAKRMGESVA